MRAIVLISDERNRGQDDLPPRFLASSGNGVPIDKLLQMLRSVGVSDRTAVAPKAGLIWSSKWHHALQARGFQLILNDRFQTPKVAYAFHLALEALQRSDSLLVFADALDFTVADIVRLAQNKAPDAAMVRAQPVKTAEESAWMVDDKGKVKPLPPTPETTKYFAGALKVSTEGLPSLKRVMEDPKWWIRPLGEALAAWSKSRSLTALG